MEPINSTLDFARAAQRPWDVVVIGAGPAGSIAALKLAKAGVGVLLVEKSQHPRYKVCGCCLNDVAVDTLRFVGFDKRLKALNAVPIEKISLHAGGHNADLKLSHGLVVSRSALDSELVRCCITEGAEYLSRTVASVGPLADESRIVNLVRDEESVELVARCVVVADGLNGRSLDNLQILPVSVSQGSRIGAGTIATELPANLFERGTIYMVCGSGGYVGMVELEDGKVDIAAAFDRTFVQSFKHPGEAANALTCKTRLSRLDLSALQWHGTTALTRQRSGVSAPGIFVIGDSASYAEPFTGEGMAWAFSSGVAVAAIVQKRLKKAGSDFSYAEWDIIQRQLVSHKQGRSMLIAQFLRRPQLVEFSTRLLSAVPILATPLVKTINSKSTIMSQSGVSASRRS